MSTKRITPAAPLPWMTSSLRLLFVLLLLAVVPALQAKPQLPMAPEALERVRHALKAELENGKFDNERLLQKARLMKFYEQRQFQSGWLDRAGVVAGAEELLQVLGSAAREGVPAGGYHQSSIRPLLEQPPAHENELARLDILLSDAFLAYSADVRSGRFAPRSVDDAWHIEPPDYRLERMLRSALESNTVLAALHSMPPYQGGYRRLRRALHDYREIAAQGGWPQLSAGPALQHGVTSERVALLRQRLLRSGDLLVKRADNEQQFDAALQQAVQRFQYRHGLVEDGVVGEATRLALNVPVEQRIGQLLANMERWRWLPRHTEAHYLMVNMTGYVLDVMAEDKSVLQMRVIIGNAYRQTPVFDSLVTELIFNPSWFVPPTVFRHDLLPLLKSDSGYLARHNMTVLADLPSGGRVVDPATIEWGAYDAERFPYVLRQGPGEGNPLGRVKFVIPNDHGIYLHDTSQRALFARSTRTFSSGCIRLEKPLELARYLLEQEPGMAAETITSHLSSERTVSVKLNRPLPVYLLYWTAWVDEDGGVQFRDDIYNRDARLIAQLNGPELPLLSQQSTVVDSGRSLTP